MEPYENLNYPHYWLKTPVQFNALLRLRHAVKKSPFVYAVSAFALTRWYAILEFTSRVVSAARGVETLVGVDFLPRNIVHEKSFEFNLAACLRFKNEAPYLKEWIEYHLMVGIQRFVLYNNNSDDDYLSVLRPYIEKKFVDLRNWPAIPASPSAELDCIASYRDRARWIAFIDADEFIVPTKAASVTSALETIRPQNGLAINWRYFGSNFHQCKPKGLVTAAYTRSAERLDKHVKCIVDPRRVIKYGGPHFWYFQKGHTATNAAGKSVYGAFCWQGIDDTLVIHHYVHKSAEEYLARARLATRADAIGMKAPSRRENALTRAFPQHNDIENRSMARFLNELAERCNVRLDSSQMKKPS